MLHIKINKSVICTILLIATLPVMMGAGLSMTSPEKTNSTPVATTKTITVKEQTTESSPAAINVSQSAVAVQTAEPSVPITPTRTVNRGGLTNRTIRTFEYLVMDEAGGGSYELQLATAELVINRWHGPYGNDLYNIMTAPNAFSGISNGTAFEDEPTEEVKQAVQDALNGKKSGKLTEDTYYCCVPEISQDLWMLDPNRADFVIEIDNVHFYKPKTQ